jgi:hypothetical protein
MLSVVVGNGESRRHIDLNQLKSKNTIIGCNALHRDISVDHLICCDRRMVDEAILSDNTAETKIYVREDWFRYFRKIKKDKRINLLPKLPYDEQNTKADKPDHWGSGPYAVLLAANLQFKKITLVGFDLYPKNDRINNIYKGTKNYKDRDSNAVDYNYWVYQIGKIFQHFPQTEFIILNNDDWKMPKEWKYSNVKFTSLENKII